MTPRRVVNGGSPDAGSLDVEDLYFGKAKPKRVSMPKESEGAFNRSFSRARVVLTFKCCLS